MRAIWKGRLTRLSLLGLAAAFELAVVLSQPASAQFVCTTTATDTTCTNTGAAASGTNVETNKNVTTNNSGSVAGSVTTDTTTGNATTTNSGSIGGSITTVTSTGNATTTNFGQVGGSITTDTTTGNATTTNLGSVAGSITTVTSTGDAATTNSGSVGGSITTDTTTGNATTTNSASVAGSITTVTTTGNATTTNSGSLGGSITTDTTTGNATTTNSGALGGSITTVTTTGNAATTNSGALGGSITTDTTTGNATTTNSGALGGSITTVTSTGNATTTNSGALGGSITTVTSTGNATTTNSGAIGGSITTVTTAGNATTTNSGALAGSITTVTSAGNAVTANGGIVRNSINTISNAGSATTINGGTVLGPVATVSGGGGTATLINSGTISNFGGTAVAFGGGPDTLVLLAGSRIIGSINLLGVNDTVNFLSGNHNLTFNTLAGARVTGSIPFAVLGNRAAAVDPTAFAMSERVLMDFSRTVSSSIPMIDSRPGAAPALTSFADSDVDGNKRIAEAFANIPGMSAYAADAPVYKSPTVAYRDGTVLWARGFAGQRLQRTDDTVLHNFNQFYGGMIGGDWGARSDLRLGAFIGGGHTRSTTDFTVGDTTSDLIFGGAYARYFWGNSFLHGVVQVGHSNSDTTRNVNNNLLPTGLEVAKASYGGWYVSPELTYGFHYGLPSIDGAAYTLTPSVQVRYLYASFDGYTETGTTAPLTINTHTLGDLEERGQLKLTRTISGRTETLATSVYGGVLGVQRVGDTVGAVLLGQTIPFAMPGEANVWAGFGGAEFALRAGNIAMFLAGEYYAFSDSSNVASGRGGLRISF